MAFQLQPLRKRWTPARYAARMAKRQRRADGIRPDRRAPVHIPAPESVTRADAFPLSLGIPLGILWGILSRGRRRR